MASETIANDRCARFNGSLFSRLWKSTRYKNTVALWKITRVQIQEEPPAKAVLKMRMESPNLLEN